MNRQAWGASNRAIDDDDDDDDDDDESWLCNSDSTISEVDFDEVPSDSFMHALEVTSKLEDSLLRYMSRVEDDLPILVPVKDHDLDTCMFVLESAVYRMKVAIERLNELSRNMPRSVRKREKADDDDDTGGKTKAAATVASSSSSQAATPSIAPALSIPPVVTSIRTGVIRLIQSPSNPASATHHHSTLSRVKPPATATATSTSAAANLPPVPRFYPPSDTRSIGDVFDACFGSPSKSIPGRYIGRLDPRMVLVRVDGACSSNGSISAKGACGVFYRPTDPNVAFALEKCGPTGERVVHTNNRAELRAAIAAIDVRPWKRENFDTLVVATDSAYVVNGATGWVKGWQSREWVTGQGHPVKNRDLWEELLRSVERVNRNKLRVLFWHIPRQWNSVADWLAKEALSKDPMQDWWSTEVLLGGGR